MMRAVVVGALLAAVVAIGCGGQTGQQGSGTAAAAQACGPNPDASASGCSASRAFLVCADPNGGGMSCPADDPTQTQCQNNRGPYASGGPWACHDQCKATEYSLACGGIGPNAPQGTPPPACRGVAVTPAGIAYFCCPCGP